MTETVRHAGSTSTGSRLSTGGRVLSGAVALCCIVVLAFAAWMTPDARGLGTHRQLGMPPCGWMTFLGRPCITCGMTTSFSHAARGQLVRSFLAQPMGCVLAITTATAFWPALWGAWVGARVDRMLAPLARTRVLWGLGLGLLAAWGYKLLTFP